MSEDLVQMKGPAGRYAAALFDLAVEADALDAVEQDMGALRSAIGASADFARFLKSPVYGRAEQINAVAAIAQKAGYNPLTVNFLKLVAANGRLFALDAMIGAFNALAARHRGEIFAKAITAHPMNEEQIKALRLEIEAMVGKAVNLETQVDSGLLGGLVVKIGSRMIDASLRTKLNRMKSMMKEA